MKIQSLSVAVPCSCLNNCKFCVAHMHQEEYKNQIEGNFPFSDLYAKDYTDRLQYARDNGCNSLVITGDGEPLLNKNFLDRLAWFNKSLSSPFKDISLQTSGTLLDENYLRFLRNTVGVTTISLSLSSFFSDINAEINQTTPGHKVNIINICKLIKKYDFNLRLSLNLSSEFDKFSPEEIISNSKSLGANQVTLRKLYSQDECTPQSEWVKEHEYKKFYYLNKYVTTKGRILERLPFGAIKYSLRGMGIVIDDDCMSQYESDVLKYLILRPDCKIYSKWDDKGSLIF